MTPSDAETIAQFITSRLTFLQGGGWEDQSYREDPRWGDTALAPLAALVGSVEQIEYVSGYVGRPSKRDHRVEVRIVVFTDASIIRAEADADPASQDTYLSAVRTWAVPRSSVEAVRVTRTSRFEDKRTDTWPAILDLDLHLQDGTNIALPLNPEAFNRDYSGLYGFAQTLFPR